jgi:hypothetical protein
METLANSVIEQPGSLPGQGNVLEQIEKLLRRQQRRRRMTERRGSLSEMSKEEAALIGAAIKVVLDPAKL